MNKGVKPAVWSQAMNDDSCLAQLTMDATQALAIYDLISEEKFAFFSDKGRWIGIPCLRIRQGR